MQELLPPTEADIKLITGDQRSGKTGTGVAFAKDDYHAQLNGIMSPSGNIIKAKALTDDDRAFLRKNHVVPHPFKHIRVFSDDEKQSKIILLPKDYLVVSPVRIFANLHVFGMRASYITVADIIQYMNTDVMTNAWFLSDESAMTDPRNSMDSVGKLVAQWAATIGKKNLHFCQMSQYMEMIERRLRLFATTKILCTYDKNTQTVTYDMKKKGEPSSTHSFWLPYYWMNFRTGEWVPMPEGKMTRALQTLGYSR